MDPRGSVCIHAREGISRKLRVPQKAAFPAVVCWDETGLCEKGHGPAEHPVGASHLRGQESRKTTEVPAHNGPYPWRERSKKP